MATAYGSDNSDLSVSQDRSLLAIRATGDNRQQRRHNPSLCDNPSLLLRARYARHPLKRRRHPAGNSPQPAQEDDEVSLLPALDSQETGSASAASGSFGELSNGIELLSLSSGCSLSLVPKGFQSGIPSIPEDGLVSCRVAQQHGDDDVVRSDQQQASSFDGKNSKKDGGCDANRKPYTLVESNQKLLPHGSKRFQQE